MQSAIPAIILGIILIVLGCFNTRGNITAIHHYHRKNVSEEDRVPFGKLVGLGNIIIGVAVILYGTISWINESLKNATLDIVLNDLIKTRNASVIVLKSLSNKVALSHDGVKVYEFG